MHLVVVMALLLHQFFSFGSLASYAMHVVVTLQEIIYVLVFHFLALAKFILFNTSTSTSSAD